MRQSPILGFFESVPEVRVLCSAGITRPQRSYDPVRLPPGPPPENDVEAATLTQNGSPPITRNTFPTCRAHYPGGSSGCICRFLPRACCLPQMAGGSASALALSRPAQASQRYGPPDRSAAQGDLCHEASARPVTRTKLLVSYRTYRQLSVWIPPPLVFRAFGAHCQ